MSTNIGRLLIIGDTKDTGPLSSAQNDSTIPTGDNVSLKASSPIVEFLRFMSINCPTMWGRIEIEKKMVVMQNVVIQNMFQADM